MTNSGGLARVLAVGVAVAFVSVPIAASAIPANGPLQGHITFAGAVTPNGPDFELADTLNFPEQAIVLGGSSTTGHFAVLKFKMATFGSIVYDPTSVPIADLWTVDCVTSSCTPEGIWSFQLDTLVVKTRTPDRLQLSGSGTLDAPNFTKTGGIWTLNASEDGTARFSFDSKTVAIVNPEPGGLALFATGMAVVAFALRPRARAA